MILNTLEHGMRAALIGLRVLHARRARLPRISATSPLRLHGVRT
jgi:hypothetical protein